jgi:autotransporter-associated beta strand protein
LLTSANYNPSGLPNNATDVRLTSPSTNLTITGASSVTMESLTVDNAKGYTISNATSGGGNATLNLGNPAGFTNFFSGVNDDLIYLTNGSSLVIQGPNSSSGTGTLTLALASSGNFNISSNSTLNVSAVITGVSRSITLSNSGVVILGGANTYSGDTAINAGELRFAAGGSSNNSTIRLGNTTANSPSATLSLSNAFGGANGVNVASPLEVRASGSGTQGTRVIRSLATSGTNTYSGVVTMNAGLTLESATNGTLLFQGGSIDVKTNVLTVDTQVDLNGTNSVNMQGAVTINEALGSTSATGGSLVKDGGNTLILQGTSNTYTGTNAAALNPNGTRIAGGVLGIYGDGSLGLAPTVATNNVFFTASSLSSPPATRTLQDTSGNVTLAATRNINIASAVTGTFDSNGNIFTINGNINGAGGNLEKIGLGSLVLANANTYTGTTTINGGTLNAAATNALGGTTGITVNSGGTLLLSNSGTTNRINDGADIKLNGGTFNTGGLSEHGAANNDAGVGMLTLQSSSIIDMASGASILAFANSAAQAGSWNGTLSIYNWSGTPVTGGGLDQLFFGSDPSGLLANQLADFQFYSGAGTGAYAPGAIILANGEVVPVPEPATWIGGALAVAAVGYSQRRRLSKSRRKKA